MSDILNKTIDTAIWVATSLFNRGKTSGSSANMSFMCDGRLFITTSGTCFGRLTPDDFAEVTIQGENISVRKVIISRSRYRQYTNSIPVILQLDTSNCE